MLRTPGHTPGHQACSLSCPGTLLYSELRKELEAGGKPWSTGGLDDLVVSQPSWEGASRARDGLTTVKIKAPQTIAQRPHGVARP